jgi:hypothetical protein
MNAALIDETINALRCGNYAKEVYSAIEEIYQDILLFEYDNAVSIIGRLLES